MSSTPGGATLVARGLSASHGPTPVLEDLDLVVGPGARYGLVGPNGAGKSTLLRVLAGELTPESGSVAVAPTTATVGLLPQEPDRRPGETLRAYLGRRTGVTAAQAAMDAAAEGLSTGAAGADDAYATALERWLALGGADLEVRAEEVVEDLGLGAAHLDAATTALSGGQMARAALAAVLLSRFDVLLLDEPTNDLDLDGLARLEDFVAGLRGAFVVVSHDREFLARTVTGVLDLDPHSHRVTEFGGGWDAYLEARAVARRHARERYEEYDERRQDLVDRARMQRGWADKGVRNARKKQPDNDKFGVHLRGQSAEKQAAKARQTDRMLERLEVVEEPRKEWVLRLRVLEAPRSGDVVATLDQAVVERGSFRLGPVTLEVGWADRIAITGPNGSGKSTLLQALLGRLPLAGGRQSLGPGVVLGELDQVRGRFTGRPESVVDVVRETAPDLLPEDVRTLLAKFGLKAAHVARPAASLSPGERTRAGLALLMATGVNCLVLDEPSNHLDLPALEQLEEALAEYRGTLLLVSHDRRLLEAVELTRTVRVEGGRVSS